MKSRRIGISQKERQQIRRPKAGMNFVDIFFKNGFEVGQWENL